MKLITEYYGPEVASFEAIEESSVSGGTKNMFIKGVFLQGNKKNRNGRWYPTDMLSECITNYQQNKISTGRSGGELNHPEGVEINLDRVSHLITELNMTKDDGIGKAKLLDTPCGMIAKSLIKGGMRLGVSTRGLGKLGEVVNQSGARPVSDFELVTVDIVADPSAPDAFVQGIMEGVEFYIESNGAAKKVKDGTIIGALEGFKASMATLPLKEKKQYQYSQIMGFLNAL